MNRIILGLAVVIVIFIGAVYSLRGLRNVNLRSYLPRTSFRSQSAQTSPTPNPTPLVTPSPTPGSVLSGVDTLPATGF